MTTLQEAEALLSNMTRTEKVQLVEKIMRVLEKELATAPEASQPRRSLYGMLAHLGPAPSAEEIDEARAEAWANFPRDDV